MLYLNRYIDEQIIIGDDIIITVVKIRGGQVRIGITAPNSIPVDREERANRRRRDGEGPR